jgi:hypothetical protein
MYNNGFELPTVMFILQAVVVLWVIFSLSAKKNYKETTQEEELDNNEEFEKICSETLDSDSDSDNA